MGWLKEHLGKATVAIVICVVVIWSVSAFAVHHFNKGDMQSAGQTGDMFGAVNALFTGLAFAGAVVAVLLQVHQLNLQNEEIKKSAAAQQEEIALSRKAAELHALTFCAEFHLRLMESSKGREQVNYQDLAQRYADLVIRQLDMMPFGPTRVVGSVAAAIAELVSIGNGIRSDFANEKQSGTKATDLQSMFVNAGRKLEKWLESHRGLFESDTVDAINAQCLDLRKYHQGRGDVWQAGGLQQQAQFAEWEKSVDGLSNAITSMEKKYAVTPRTYKMELAGEL